MNSVVAVSTLVLCVGYIILLLAPTIIRSKRRYESAIKLDCSFVTGSASSSAFTFLVPYNKTESFYRTIQARRYSNWKNFFKKTTAFHLFEKQFHYGGGPISSLNIYYLTAKERFQLELLGVLGTLDGVAAVRALKKLGFEVPVEVEEAIDNEQKNIRN